MWGYGLCDHQEVGSFCTLFRSQEGYQAAGMAAKTHSFSRVITSCGADNPLHRPQLRTESSEGGNLGFLRSNPAPAGCVSSENRKPTPPHPRGRLIKCCEVQSFTPPFSEMSLLLSQSLYSKIHSTSCCQVLRSSGLFSILRGSNTFPTAENRLQACLCGVSSTCLLLYSNRLAESVLLLLATFLGQRRFLTGRHRGHRH